MGRTWGQERKVKDDPQIFSLSNCTVMPLSKMGKT